MSARLLALLVGGTRAVINFLEELKILSNLKIIGLEFERFFVRLARFIELTFVLVCDREIVEGGRVRRIDFNRLFPAVDGFAPKASLRHADPERHLLFRVAACISE